MLAEQEMTTADEYDKVQEMAYPPNQDGFDNHRIQNGTDLSSLISSPKATPMSVPKSQKSGLWATYLIMLFTMIGIAIEISSSWPYLQRIDPNVSPSFLGWANVGFNVGAICGDLIFSKWMTCRPNREPIIAASVIMMLSGLGYAFAQGMGQYYGLFGVFISRVLLGITRGNMTCTRVLVAHFTTLEERSAAMANLVIAMSLGFALGSAIQSAMVQIGEKGVYISALRMHLNLYTIPAYLIVLLSIASLVITIKYIKYTPEKKKKTVNIGKNLETSNLGVGKKLACGVLVFMFSIVNFDLSIMETLLSPLIQHQFALTRAKAVFYSGLVFTTQGMIGIFQLFFIKFLSKRFKDRTLLAFTFTSVTIAFLMYIPLTNQRLKLTESFNSNNNMTSNYSRSHGPSSIGCPIEYEWCSSSGQLSMPKFIIGAVSFALGYGACLGLLVSLFSKLTHGRNPSTFMGIISALGNMGRLSAPITGAESYVRLGPMYTFLWVLLLGISGLIFFITLFKQMVADRNIGTKDHKELVPKQDHDEYCYPAILYVTPV